MHHLVCEYTQNICIIQRIEVFIIQVEDFVQKAEHSSFWSESQSPDARWLREIHCSSRLHKETNRRQSRRWPEASKVE